MAVGALPIIVTEVLQGYRTERGFRAAERVLAALPAIHPDLDCHVRAAKLFRHLRRRGMRPPTAKKKKRRRRRRRRSTEPAISATEITNRRATSQRWS